MHGVSEAARKRRERGKRRNADTSHLHGNPNVSSLPNQDHPLLIAGFIF
jgi:hypothetical protein